MAHKKEVAKHKGKKAPMNKREKEHERIEKHHEKEHESLKKYHKKHPEKGEKHHSKKPVKKSIAKNKMKKVMKEFSAGELHSGSKSGPMVTNPKQAVVIAYSEAKKAKKKHKKHKTSKSIHHSTDY